MIDSNRFSQKFEGAEARAAARDKLIFNVTDDLLIIMEDKNISKSELARRLGKSKSYVTQMLSGHRNMTLGSFSDICFALEFEPDVSLPVQPFSEEVGISHMENKKHLPWFAVQKIPGFEVLETAQNTESRANKVVSLNAYKEYKKCG